MFYEYEYNIKIGKLWIILSPPSPNSINKQINSNLHSPWSHAYGITWLHETETSGTFTDSKWKSLQMISVKAVEIRRRMRLSFTYSAHARHLVAEEERCTWLLTIWRIWMNDHALILAWVWVASSETPNCSRIRFFFFFFSFVLSWRWESS